jgi:hypothetical protein
MYVLICQLISSGNYHRDTLRPEKGNEIGHNNTNRRFDPTNRYGNRPQLLLYNNRRLELESYGFDARILQTKFLVTGAPLLVERLFMRTF